MHLVADTQHFWAFINMKMVNYGNEKKLTDKGVKSKDLSILFKDSSNYYVTMKINEKCLPSFLHTDSQEKKKLLVRQYNFQT